MIEWDLGSEIDYDIRYRYRILEAAATQQKGEEE